MSKLIQPRFNHVLLAASVLALHGTVFGATATAPATIEAENMDIKTTGSGYPGYWGLWSNGSVANQVQFNSSGKSTISITAIGAPAGGVYPTMKLLIDGREMASFTVNSTSPKAYSATVDVTAGSRKLEIAYTNDAVVNGQDRNLILDKVAITAPTTPATPTPAPTAPPVSGVPSTPATIEAEAMETRSVGGAQNGFWNIWGNGFIENRVNFQTTGTYDIRVVAQGTLAGGIGPNMEIRLDGARVAGQNNLSTSVNTYTFRVNATAGVRKVAVAFTNDTVINGQDRNLLVDKIFVVSASGSTSPTPAPTATPVPPSSTPTPTPPPTPSNPSGINRAFGTRPMQYAAGTIKPQASQADMDAAIKRSYDLWKSRYVSQMCGTGRYVVKGGQSGRLAVSEGQGYGMLITAMMAGHDPQARTIFDGIHRFTRDKMSNFSNMMAWVINNDCSKGDNWPAVDGDLDMAMALLMAHVQWGSSGSINYLEEAKKTITAIKTNIVKNNYIAGGPAPDLARTSDFMFAHFRAFQKYTGDATWNAVIDKTIGLIQQVSSSYAANTGLMPDFIENANTNNPKPITISRWPESDMVDKYAYNACRNPWRFGTDLVVSGDTRVKGILQKMMTFFRNSSGGQASGIKAGYQLNGTVFGNYTNMSFQAPVGVGAMVDSSNQAFLNNMWNFMASNTAGGYYDHSIQLISMMVMSGNWWQP